MSSNMPSSFGGMSLAQLLAGSGGGLGGLSDPSSLAQLMGAGGAFAAPAGMSYLSQDPNSVNFGGLTTAPTPAPAPVSPAPTTPTPSAPGTTGDFTLPPGWTLGAGGAGNQYVTAPDGSITYLGGIQQGAPSILNSNFAWNPNEPGIGDTPAPMGSNSLFGAPNIAPAVNPAIPNPVNQAVPAGPQYLSNDPNSVNYRQPTQMTAGGSGLPGNFTI
jgi:hypothetical protein